MTVIDGGVLHLTGLLQKHIHVCLCLLQSVSWWLWPAAWGSPPRSAPHLPAARPQRPLGSCPGRSAASESSRCWSRAPLLGWCEQRTGGADGWERRVRKWKNLRLVHLSTLFHPHRRLLEWRKWRDVSNRWNSFPQSKQLLCPHHAQEHSHHPHSVRAGRETSR